MNSVLLYRQRGRSIFWIAFMTALAIHLGAVALAKTKSPIQGVEDLSPPADAVIVDIAEPASERREESVTPPPREQIHPDRDNFQEENLTTPPPVRAHRRAMLPTFVAAGTTSLRAVRATVDFAAAPGELKFAAAVAEFGMILRDSEFKGTGSLQQVLDWAQQGKGADLNGYRADFIELVRKAQGLRKS